MANEKRLIDANALWDEVEKSQQYNPHKDGRVKLNHRTEHDHFLRMIFDAPTVDAVEVVHGRCDWCKTGEEKCGTCRMFFDYYGDGGSDKCSSECDSGKCAYYQPIGFCPNCGAKMDGDGNG